MKGCHIAMEVLDVGSWIVHEVNEILREHITSDKPTA